jgi:hypothetical protein
MVKRLWEGGRERERERERERRNVGEMDVRCWWGSESGDGWRVIVTKEV